MRLNATTKAALDAAITEDHPCEDTVGCDIAVAQYNGFPVAAAILLDGATETPTLAAFLNRYRLTLPGLHSPEFDKWCKWHHENGRECPSCESFMYVCDGQEPTWCTNCRANITQEASDELAEEQVIEAETWGACGQKECTECRPLFDANNNPIPGTETA